MNRYTKLNNQLQALPDNEKDHAAIRDNETGLIWTANNVGEGRLQHAAAIEACTKLTLGDQTDWRLPTIKELLSLVDYDSVDPAIDVDAFPSCKPNWYWSSSAYAGLPDYAWFVYFSYGNSNIFYRGLDGFVRAVRGPVAASQ